MKQTFTQYVVKHNGRAVRLTLAEEVNGVARGSIVNVKETKKATAAAYSVERFVNEVLIGLANIESLVAQTHSILGVEKVVVKDEHFHDEHLSAANIVYQGHERDGTLSALENHEEDVVLAELARSRRLYGEYTDISTLLRNRH